MINILPGNNGEGKNKIFPKASLGAVDNADTIIEGTLEVGAICLDEGIGDLAMDVNGLRKSNKKPVESFTIIQLESNGKVWITNF